MYIFVLCFKLLWHMCFFDNTFEWKQTNLFLMTYMNLTKLSESEFINIIVKLNKLKKLLFYIVKKLLFACYLFDF